MSTALEILEELTKERILLEVFDVFWAVNFWQKTGNPYFMDYVLVICDISLIEIGPALQAELYKAASARLKGFPPGEAAQVEREMQIFDYLTRMASLIHGGMNQTQAANEVVEHTHPDDGTLEFSTVYRYYTEFMKKPGYQKFVFKMMDEMNEIFPDE